MRLHSRAEAAADASSPASHAPPDPEMDVNRLMRVWRGEDHDDYAREAVIGTMAVTLRTMGKAQTMAEAQALATEIWTARDMSKLPVSG